MNQNYLKPGTGGSSFVSGCTGCNAIAESSTSTNIIHTGTSIHYSGYQFRNIVMLSGYTEMPNKTGSGVSVGNFGNGYARITLVSKG